MIRMNPIPGCVFAMKETLTIPAIVRLAEAAEERYGFRDFKLKGGVFEGAFENGSGHRAL